MKPTALEIQPPLVMATLGGAVGVIFLTALLRLAPGAPLIGEAYPPLIGGVLASDPTVAFWLGYAIFFVVGWLVWPSLITIVWRDLPGDLIDLTGALVKGSLCGIALWIMAGLLLPLLAALSRVPAAQDPGFFGMRAGLTGAAVLLLGHLGYGLSVAVIGSMGRGISPMESLGVEGYRTMGGPVSDPKTGVPEQ